MSSPHDTETGSEPGPTGPRVTRDEVRDLGRLRRSRTDRKVSGVAGGIARHLDIDPLLVRVAFVILTFFGGGGLILYGVAWVLVPEEDTGDTVIRTEEGVRTAALIIAGVLAVASVIGDSVGGMDFPWPLMVVGLVLLVVFGSKQAKENRAGHLGGPAVPPPPPGAADPTYEGYRPWVPPTPAPPWRNVDPRKRGPILFPFALALAVLALGVVGTMDLAGVDVAVSAYPATVLGVVGVMLLVGAFFGRAGGLILVGLLAAMATAGTSVVGNHHIGQIAPTIDTADELKGSYELGVGEIVIDLTDLPESELEALDDRKLELDARIGHIRVVVPDDGLKVDVDAQITAGEVVLFDQKSDSSDKATHETDDPTDPTLTIEADMVLGQVEVLTEKEAA